jgi:hypothetical protein
MMNERKLEVLRGIDRDKLCLLCCYQYDVDSMSGRYQYLIGLVISPHVHQACPQCAHSKSITTRRTNRIDRPRPSSRQSVETRRISTHHAPDPYVLSDALHVL